MSIDAEDPNDFLRWLGTHDDADREGFVARSIYGKYLSDQISTIEKAWSGRVSVCNGRAIDLERGDGRWVLTVQTRQGVLRDAFDVVVLALGTSIPGDPYQLEGSDNYHPDVYPISEWIGTAEGHRLGVVGTGLSGIDAAAAFYDSGAAGEMTMVSRRGMLPDVRDFSSVIDYDPDITRMIGQTARQRQGLEWEDVDQVLNYICLTAGIRPSEMRDTFTELSMPAEKRFRNAADSSQHSVNAEVQRAVVGIANHYINDLWSLMRASARRIFLKQYHSSFQSLANPLPPQTARKLSEMMNDGRLGIQPGVQQIEPVHGGFRLCLKADVREVERVVNATKMPGGSLAGAAGSLLASLTYRGIAIKNPFGGLRIDPAVNLIKSPQGFAQPGLYALGEVTVGDIYYISSISKIRDRAQEIVRHFRQMEG